MTEKDILVYQAGTLLYTPALNGLSEKLLTFPDLKAIAFCLEDSIRDNALEQAEAQVCRTFEHISTYAAAHGRSPENMPLFFVRIRSPQHMQVMWKKLAGHVGFLTGFVLPKYDLSNAQGYTEVLRTLHRTPAQGHRQTPKTLFTQNQPPRTSQNMPQNSAAGQDIHSHDDIHTHDDIHSHDNIHNHDNTPEPEPIYMMPILESSEIAHKETRLETLIQLRRILDQIQSHVLTVRVGGNDLCHVFGVRRSVSQTIYDIGTVREVLFDILNIFGRKYGVSAPVWEYFDTSGSDTWKTGLRRETALDKLNGFVGKTAIHPSQLPVIAEEMMVTRNDYTDALQILNWTPPELGVSKSHALGRMNEMHVHATWAQQTLRRAKVYGIGQKD